MGRNVSLTRPNGRPKGLLGGPKRLGQKLQKAEVTWGRNGKRPEVTGYPWEYGIKLVLVYNHLYFLVFADMRTMRTGAQCSRTQSNWRATSGLWYRTVTKAFHSPQLIYWRFVMFTLVFLMALFWRGQTPWYIYRIWNEFSFHTVFVLPGARSIAAHRDHFVRRLSVRPSVCLSVCLSVR